MFEVWADGEKLLIVCLALWRGARQVNREHFFSALPIRLLQHVSLRVKRHTAALAVVHPALAHAVGDKHRCSNLLRPSAEDGKSGQPATIVGIEDQLRSQCLGPLDATRCFPIGTDETSSDDAIDRESLRAGSGIVPSVLVAVSLVFLLAPEPSLVGVHRHGANCCCLRLIMD